MVKFEIVIVFVLLFRFGHSDSSVIQRLIVRLEDPSSHPSSDNCTLFKQIEVSLSKPEMCIFNSGVVFEKYFPFI